MMDCPLCHRRRLAARLGTHLRRKHKITTRFQKICPPRPPNVRPMREWTPTPIKDKKHPHECVVPECGKKYRMPYQLNYHVVTAHGEFERPATVEYHKQKFYERHPSANPANKKERKSRRLRKVKDKKPRTASTVDIRARNSTA